MANITSYAITTKEQKERKYVLHPLSYISLNYNHIQGIWEWSHKTVSAGNKAKQSRKRNVEIVLEIIFPILCIRTYFNTHIFNLSGGKYRLIFWLLNSDLEKRGTYSVFARAPEISICFRLSPPVIKQVKLFKFQLQSEAFGFRANIKKDNGTSARSWSCIFWVVQATRFMLGRPTRDLFTWRMTLTPTLRSMEFLPKAECGRVCLSYWLCPAFHVNKLTWKIAKAPLSFLMLALNPGFSHASLILYKKQRIIRGHRFQ